MRSDPVVQLPDLRIALYQPDIPGNTGAIMRLAACFGVGLDVIGPVGFDMSDRALRRAGMDYREMAALRRHDDWDAFDVERKQHGRRLVLFTTAAAISYADFAFASSDILLFGRETAGAPEHVHAATDARLLIPMPGGGRSLNLAMSAAIGLSEAMRQLRAADRP